MNEPQPIYSRILSLFRNNPLGFVFSGVLIAWAAAVFTSYAYEVEISTGSITLHELLFLFFGWLNCLFCSPLVSVIVVIIVGFILGRFTQTQWQHGIKGKLVVITLLVLNPLSFLLIGKLAVWLERNLGA